MLAASVVHADERSTSARATAAAPSPFDRGAKGRAARSPFDRGKPRKPPPTCADATTLPCPRRDHAAPAQVETRLTADYLARLPTADGDVTTAANATLGASRDDAGVGFAGATGADTRWTVDGAAVDDPYLGGAGLRVPLAFVDAVRVTHAGFGAADDVGVGGAVDAELRRAGTTTRAQAHAWLGAGRAPDWRARVPGEYTLFRGRYASLRTLSADATVDGQAGALAGGALWYAAGVAPQLDDQSLVRDSFRLVDRDGDSFYDRDRGLLVHDPIAHQTRAALAYDVPVLARLGWRTAHHALEATMLLELARAPRWIVSAETSAAGIDRHDQRGIAIARWRGHWPHLELAVRASWYRAAQIDRARLAGGDAPAIGYGVVPSSELEPAGDPGDAAVRAACSDSTGDPFPLLANCPFVTGYYWLGGVGALADLTIDRPQLAADVVHTRGEHRLAAGAVVDDVRAVAAVGFSGGFRRQVPFADLAIDTRYVELGAGPDSCDGMACRFLDRDRRTYRTRNLAAYLVDTWRPASAVAVEYGVRWQASQLGTAVELRDWLPRIGASWDPLGAGRSRVFAGWSRYAAPIAAGLGTAVFAGPTTLRTAELGGTTSQSIEETPGMPVAAGVRATRVDETVGGAEVGWPDVIRIGVMARARHLGRALDDDAGWLATAGTISGVAATREQRELAAWLDGSPRAELAVRVGYSYARLTGNWPGPFDPTEGFTLGASSLFDSGPTAALANATGALPGDQPHRFFAELALRGRRWGLALDGGLRATISSGRPRSARIGSGQDFAVARGSLGRLPTQTQANLHLGARRGRARLTLDIFNLFDRRGALAIDDRYASDAEGIAGGEATDLVWLKDIGGTGLPAARNRRYGQPTRTQAPIAAFLGVAIEL